jgi:hypothetical protein
MLVHFFVVSTNGKNPIKIEMLHKKLDPNSPTPLPYEGGTGLNYLCCVDTSIDVKTICLENGYECHTLYPLEIEDTKYNNHFYPHPTYNKDGAQYKVGKP